MLRGTGVKSEYTYFAEEEKNDAKLQACADQGYQAEIRIYDPKGDLVCQLLYNAIE